MSSPIQVSFHFNSCAQRLNNSAGHKKNRIQLLDLKDTQGKYRIAFQQTSPNKKSKCVKSRRWVFLNVTHEGSVLCLKVNAASLRKRLGIDKKVFNKHLKTSNDFTSYISNELRKHTDFKDPLDSIRRFTNKTPETVQRPTPKKLSPKSISSEPKSIELTSQAKAALIKIKHIAKSSKLNDKIVGLIVGQAVGDALGVNTQDFIKESAREVVALGPFSYTTRYHTKEFIEIEKNHAPDRVLTFDQTDVRQQVPFGGWTFNTDQALSIVDVLEDNPSPEEAQKKFAQNLVNLLKKGCEGRDFSPQINGRETPRFPTPKALYLKNSIDLLNINHEAFAENPTKFALEDLPGGDGLRWGIDKGATNDALARTSSISAVYFNDPVQLQKTSIALCETTHVSPQAVAGCLAANFALAEILIGVKDFEKIKEAALKHTLPVLISKMVERKIYERIVENFQYDLERNVDSNSFLTLNIHYAIILMLRGETDFDKIKKMAQFSKVKSTSLEEVHHAVNKRFEEDLTKAIQSPDLESIKLDGNKKLGENIGHVYKCLGAGFVTLKKAIDLLNQGKEKKQVFQEAMTELLAEGGDAISHGALASAMLGAYLGYDAIPEGWKDLRDQEVLLKTIDKLRLSKKHLFAT